MPISRPDPDVRTYLDHLRYLLGFHEPVEQDLRQVEGLSRTLPDVDRRWKTESLRKDLGQLAGEGPRVAPDRRPRAKSVPEALGVLYVLEGATLGARTLLPILRRGSVLSGPAGMAYLSGYGADTARMWAGLSAVLNRVGPQDAEVVLDWATATFEALLAWRRDWEKAA